MFAPPLAPNFTITALPTPLTVPAIGQSSFSVGLTGTGGFTTLASLSVTGLPTGMTGVPSACPVEVSDQTSR